jgi:hypothetical protein
MPNAVGPASGGSDPLGPVLAQSIIDLGISLFTQAMNRQQEATQEISKTIQQSSGG